jgi:hypothetical protein
MELGDKPMRIVKRSASYSLLFLLAVLGGCHGAPGGHLLINRPEWGAGAPGLHVKPPILLPVAGGLSPRAFVATTGGGTLSGTVAFQTITNPFFSNNAASWRVLSANPTQNALLSLSTLEGDLYTQNGNVINGVSAPDGSFHFNGTAPLSQPYLITADLAASHRLSAIVASGVPNVNVDEASSMVAETARWQLRPAPPPGPYLKKTLQDITPFIISTLYNSTLAVMQPGDFPATGAVPVIPALQAGAGFLLRNDCVKDFGTQVTASGFSAANTLSDLWDSLLGFRPLAFTRVAGNGVQGFNGGDGKPATTAELTSPTDAVYDGTGNMFITSFDEGLIRYVPVASSGGGLFGWTAPMTGGNLYTVGGVINGAKNLGAFNAAYWGPEQTASAASGTAPALDDAVPANRPSILSPNCLVAKARNSALDLYLTSRFGMRVLFIPGSDWVNGFGGRSYMKNRLYTLAGNGIAPVSTGGTDANNNPIFLASDVFDAQAAYDPVNPTLLEPAAVALDAVGNVYILDDQTGLVRVIRQSDGKIYTLKLTHSGNPFYCYHAQDLKIYNNALYIADTNDAVIFSVPLPTAAAVAGWTTTATEPTLPISIAFGQFGNPGYIDLTQTGGHYPANYDLNDGIPAAEALLNAPTSLDFDADGNMTVADNARLHLLNVSTQVAYAIAGGLDTPYLEGDSRLAYLPGTAFINYDPATRTKLLVADKRETVVRQLWANRRPLF